MAKSEARSSDEVEVWGRDRAEVGWSRSNDQVGGGATRSEFGVQVEAKLEVGRGRVAKSEARSRDEVGVWCRGRGEVGGWSRLSDEVGSGVTKGQPRRLSSTFHLGGKRFCPRLRPSSRSAERRRLVEVDRG